MGWFREDHPGHEGYTVGLVLVEPPKARCVRTPRKNPHDCQKSCPGAGRWPEPCTPIAGPGADEFLVWLSAGDKWRELRYPDLYEGPIKRVQGACACGWRSQPFYAPYGTSYSPNCVWFEGDVEEKAEADIVAQWEHHMTTPAPAMLRPVKP